MTTSQDEIRTAEDGSQYIDLDPTWQEILPAWLMLYRQAVLGDCTNPSLIRANAEAELRNMAKAADNWNEHCKALQAGEFHLVGGPGS